MESEIIKNKLMSKGYNQSMLAEVIDCSPSLVSKVIWRRAVSLRVANAIATVIGEPRENVFPELGERKIGKKERLAKLQELKDILFS